MEQTASEYRVGGYGSTLGTDLQEGEEDAPQPSRRFVEDTDGAWVVVWCCASSDAPSCGHSGSGGHISDVER